jgi:sensor histidine kinase regulating citrate/malate metabolism
MIRAFQNLSLKVRVAVFTLGLLLFAIAILTWQFSTHLRQELEEKLSRGGPHRQCGPPAH